MKDENKKRFSDERVLDDRSYVRTKHKRLCARSHDRPGSDRRGGCVRAREVVRESQSVIAYVR
jgi:hypothetical protein